MQKTGERDNQQRLVYNFFIISEIEKQKKAFANIFMYGSVLIHTSCSQFMEQNKLG